MLPGMRRAAPDEEEPSLPGREAPASESASEGYRGPEPDMESAVEGSQALGPASESANEGFTASDGEPPGGEEGPGEEEEPREYGPSGLPLVEGKEEWWNPRNYESGEAFIKALAEREKRADDRLYKRRRPSVKPRGGWLPDAGGAVPGAARPRGAVRGGQC
jgi:hypothetical protein